MSPSDKNRHMERRTGIERRTVIASWWQSLDRNERAQGRIDRRSYSTMTERRHRPA